MSAVPGRGARWLAFTWGLAEATCFFIVPDVLSTRLVLQDRKSGFAACLWSLAGALPGGVILYLLGRDPGTADSLLRFFDYLPGIHPTLGAEARHGLAEQGAATLFAGFMGGIPYKLYAVQAAGAGLALPVFLVVSAAARLSRFLLSTTLCWLLGRWLQRKVAQDALLRIHAAGWIVFYAAYFWRLGL
jgi:membrane protein YqaA with SNARE-associated domain